VARAVCLVLCRISAHTRCPRKAAMAASSAAESCPLLR
jgi:hypothetical protein